MSYHSPDVYDAIMDGMRSAELEHLEKLAGAPARKPSSFPRPKEFTKIAPGTDVKAIRELVGDPYWRSLDGRKCRLSELEFRHLCNIIAKMERENWKMRHHGRMLIEYAIRIYENPNLEPKP